MPRKKKAAPDTPPAAPKPKIDPKGVAGAVSEFVRKEIDARPEGFREDVVAVLEGQDSDELKYGITAKAVVNKSIDMGIANSDLLKALKQ